MDEAVSPELALIDPALALRLRLKESQRLARLEEFRRPDGVSQLGREHSRLAGASELERTARTRSRLVFTAVLAAVVGFGAAVASIEIAHVPVRPARAAPEIVEVPAPSIPGGAGVPAAGSSAGAPVHGENQAAAQRAVFALLPRAARTSMLLRSIVDPVTGLVRDGTTVRCPHPTLSVFECLVATTLSQTAVAVRRNADGDLRILDTVSGSAGARSGSE